MWRLFPKFRPFIDTRLVLRTADEFAEFLRASTSPRASTPSTIATRLTTFCYPPLYRTLPAPGSASLRQRALATGLHQRVRGALRASPGRERAPFGLGLSSAASCDRVLSTMQAKYSSPRLLEAARSS